MALSNIFKFEQYFCRLITSPPIKLKRNFISIFCFFVFQAFDQFIFISSSSKKRNTGIEITVSNFFLCFEIHFVRTIMIEWKVKIGFVELDYETKYVSPKSLQKKIFTNLGYTPWISHWTLLYPLELHIDFDNRVTNLSLKSPIIIKQKSWVYPLDFPLNFTLPPGTSHWHPQQGYKSLLEKSNNKDTKIIICHSFLFYTQQVYVFVLNHEEDFDVCLNKMSADGVMTDYPSRLSNFIKSNMKPQSATEDQPILKKE